MHRSPVGRRTVRALTAVSCAAVLASCGGDDAGPEREVGGGSGARGTPATAAGGSGSGAGDRPGRDRSTSWPGGSDDRDVVARRRVGGAKPYDSPSKDPVTVDLIVRGLTVRGRTATLRITAIPRGWRGATRDEFPALYELNPGPSSEGVSAQLIDPVNLRRHLPLEDSEGESVATMTYAGQNGDGQPIEASWIFAAPPGDVRSMDVQVGNWPIFREVPVDRR
jgi:hypothetical protein